MIGKYDTIIMVYQTEKENSQPHHYFDRVGLFRLVGIGFRLFIFAVRFVFASLHPEHLSVFLVRSSYFIYQLIFTITCGKITGLEVVSNARLFFLLSVSFSLLFVFFGRLGGILVIILRTAREFNISWSMATVESRKTHQRIYATNHTFLRPLP